MNNKIALITLIDASIVATLEEKLVLIDMVPSLTDAQVDALGKYFARERELTLAQENEIMDSITRTLSQTSPNDAEDDSHVYVGSGKATGV